MHAEAALVRGLHSTAAPPSPAKPTWHGFLPAGSDTTGRTQRMARCWAAKPRTKAEITYSQLQAGGHRRCTNRFVPTCLVFTNTQIMIPLMDVTLGWP